MQEIPLITNIQRFCLHDGPGIRTTIFIKGCSLRCPWCSNPECQNPNYEIYFQENKCLHKRGVNCNINCGELFKSLQKYSQINGENSSIYEIDFKNFKESCPTKSLGVYGKKYSVEEIMGILKKDILYFRNSGGGVTFSGGEPLLFNMRELFMAIKREGINICVETSLFISTDVLRDTLPYIDILIIDIKILDEKLCKTAIGGDITQYFNNIEYLMKNAADTKFMFRFPVVYGYTYTQKNFKLLLDFINTYGITNLEIFSVHNLGKEKYNNLKRNYKDFEIVRYNDLKRIKEEIEVNTNANVNILFF
jgi:pyruvate formate lyase activating enzyme